MAGERNEQYPDWMMGALAQQGNDPAPPDPVPMGSLASDQDNQAASPLRITVRPKSFQDYLDDSSSGQQPADQLIPPPRFGFDDPANPVNQTIGQKAHELLDLGATPRDLLRGDPRYQVTPEVPGQWSERDQYRQDQLDDERATRAATIGFHMTGYGAAGSPLREYGLGAGGGRMVTPPPRGRPNLNEMFAPKPPAAIGIPGVDEAAANISPAMRGLQERGSMLGAPLQSTEEAAGGALKGISDIFKQDMGQAIQRDAMVRGRSGRPIQTAPLPIGTEDAILQHGYEMATGPRPPMVSQNFKRLEQDLILNDPDYVYHATNMERARDIAAEGKLNTHRPGDFTDQNMWPDGATQKRNYFSQGNPWMFAPEDGAPTILRIRKSEHPFQSEKYTNDVYSTKPVPSSKIEYLDQSGSWNPLQPQPIPQPPFMQAAARKGPPVMGDVAAQPALTLPGIRAYHSSPYDFDRFDMSKIGTGEGAQSYGHGLYFAENPAVSGQGGEYWKAFANRFGRPERSAADFLATAGFDRNAAINDVRLQMADPRMHHSPDSLKRTQEILDLLESGKPVGPRTYEVNINAHPEQFLDWDKPLSKQPHIANAVPQLTEAAKQEAYQRALAATHQDRADQLWGMVRDPMQAPAGFAYEHLAPRRPGGSRGEEATNILKRADIPGIKYLDQGSRNLAMMKAEPHEFLDGSQGWRVNGPRGDRLFYTQPEAEAFIKSQGAGGTSNYVLFDDKLIDILRKYGIAGMLGGSAGGMGELARQNDYQQ
jgi:hypothetical protein